MKELLSFALILVVFPILKLNAQDPGFHLHFLHNNFHNPSSAALTENQIISMNYRKQWKGQFSSAFASYEHPFPNLNSGAGLNFIYDKAGSFTEYDVGLFYNYRLKIIEDLYLRIGIEPKIKWKSIAFGSLIFNPGMPHDPLIPNDTKTANSFNLNTGISLTWKNLHFGASVADLLESTYDYTDTFTSTEKEKRYSIHLSYDWEMLAQWNIYGAGIYRKYSPFDTYDFAFYATYIDHFSFGTSFRPKSDVKKMGLLTGIHFSPVKLMAYYELQKSILGRTFEVVAQFEY